jgi:uncharacterized phage-like protein YoqJ
MTFCRNRIVWLGLLTIIAGFACTSTNATAATLQELYNLVPEKALGLALIPNMTQADAAVMRLSQKAQVPLGPPTTIIKALFHIENGLQDDGPAAIVFMPPEKEGQWQPDMVGIFATSDFDALIKPFSPEKESDEIWSITLPGDRKMLAAAKEGFAILAIAEKKSVLKACLSGNSATFLAKAESWSDWLDGNAVNLIVNQKGALSTLLGGIDSTIENLSNFQAPPPKSAGSPVMEAPIKMLQSYREMISWNLEQVSITAVGLNVDEDGFLSLAVRAKFIDGSEFDKMADATKPFEGNLLTELPKEPYIVSGGIVFNEQLIEFFNKLNSHFSQFQFATVGKLDEKQRAKFNAANEKAMKHISQVAFSAGLLDNDQPLLKRMNVYYLMKIDDSTAFMKDYKAAQEETIKLFNEQTFPDDNNFVHPKLTINSIKIGNRPSVVISFDMGLPDKVMQDDQLKEEAQEIFKDIWGKDFRIDSYLTELDKNLVALTMSKSAVQTLLDVSQKSKSDLTTEPQIEQIANRLPKGSQMSAFLDLTSLAKFFSSVPGPGQMFANIPFPECPPIAMAARFEEGQIEKIVVIAPETIKSAFAFWLQMATFNTPQEIPQHKRQR